MTLPRIRRYVDPRECRRFGECGTPYNSGRSKPGKGPKSGAPPVDRSRAVQMCRGMAQYESCMGALGYPVHQPIVNGTPWDPYGEWGSPIREGAGDFLWDLTGIPDANDCVHGSASGCGWTAAAFLPFGLGKLAKFVRRGGAAGRAAGAADDVVGPYGAVSRTTLAAAAASGGSTTRVVTNLPRPPQAGRGLSVAYGDGADALAAQARTGGTFYTAQIPNALLRELERVGLVQFRTTDMGGVVGPEFRFLPGATEFVVPFFGGG